jgi:hypothetical protein
MGTSLRGGVSISCGCGGLAGRAPADPRPRGGPEWSVQGDRFIYCGEPCLTDGAGGVAIPLSGGIVTWVDAGDFSLAAAHYWSPQRRTKSATTYAIRARRIRTGSGHLVKALHRLILDPPPSIEVDHRDRDGLNNRRQNLRVATSRQNVINREMPLGALGYRGVYRHRNRFIARITDQQGRRLLSSHKSAEEAAMAYDEAALRFHGDFALLNFPRGES